MYLDGGGEEPNASRGFFCPDAFLWGVLEAAPGGACTEDWT